MRNRYRTLHPPRWLEWTKIAHPLPPRSARPGRPSVDAVNFWPPTGQNASRSPPHPPVRNPRPKHLRGLQAMGPPDHRAVRFTTFIVRTAQATRTRNLVRLLRACIGRQTLSAEMVTRLLSRNLPERGKVLKTRAMNTPRAGSRAAKPMRQICRSGVTRQMGLTSRLSFAHGGIGSAWCQVPVCTTWRFESSLAPHPKARIRKGRGFGFPCAIGP